MMKTVAPPKMIITRGVSASGKSTWANRACAEAAKKGRMIIVVSRDTIRWDMMRARGITEPTWKDWKQKDEPEVTRRQDEILNAAIRQGTDIIVDDTNLRRDRVQWFRVLAERSGYDFEVRDFNITWEEAIARDTARSNGVGYSVLAKQFQNHYGERRVHRPNRPSAVIVDIDGTLAHMNKKRGPFEWHRVDVDDPDRIVIATIQGLYAQGIHIIVTSGRDGNDECRIKTKEWLNKHLAVEHLLLMREEGDNRADDVVKEEIYRTNIEPHYNVVGVFDDRPKVCRRWRQLGLKVFQVANPYIEF